jgi:GAF domain-containing protein
VVVPVLDRAGSLIAVFDVDSTRRAAFDQQDVAGLEQMVRWFAGEGRG